MTNDKEEGDDTIKIEINEDNKYKQFFEKGLNALLSDPHFLLLYVPENGTKMQVIRPSRDPDHRRRMIKRINEAEGIPSFYYALSHLWGISPDNRYHWNDISGYVEEDGEPVKPVSMRPEKRDTLLALLKDHPDSYWWIDVLCARTDTPLDIMGNIYTYCLECIAMIDCEPDLIPRLPPLLDRLDKAHGPYSPSEDVYPAVDLLFTLMQSKWWERVWTWQEMALPFGEVRLTAETGGHTRDTISLDSITERCGLLDTILVCEENALKSSESKNTDGDARMTKLQKIVTCLREILYARDFNSERIRCERIPFEFARLIRTWGKSTRRCMDPVDYVYGVLGLLRVEIPRMADSNAVWHLFLSKLNYYVDMLNASYHPGFYIISDKARQIDLQNVKCMADVYRNLIE